MKKIILFAALLFIITFSLFSCSKNENVEIDISSPVNDNTQFNEESNIATEDPNDNFDNEDQNYEEPSENSNEFNFDNGDYDPLSEEDNGIAIDSNYNEDSNLYEDNNQEDYVDNESEDTNLNDFNYQDISNNTFNNTNTFTAGTRVNAGSTPIPILPSDLPTPTPRQALQFNYEEYYASNINLKFQAPSGWEKNESILDSYVLTEPLNNQKDQYSASISIKVQPINNDYNHAEMVKEIRQQLDQMGSTNYSRWSPSKTADRELLGKKGVYANYKGTLVTGVKVAGRIHVVSTDRKLITLHVSYPADYTNDFVGVYSKIRKTIDFLTK